MAGLTVEQVMATGPRPYSAAERNAFAEAAKILFAEGMEDADRNWQVLELYLDKHREQPATVENIVRIMRNREVFQYKTQARINLDRVLASYDHTAADQIISIFGRQKQLINTDSDQGYRNLTLILSEMTGWEVTEKTFWSAVQRIQWNSNKTGNPNRVLHFVDTSRKLSPVPEGYKPGRLIEQDQPVHERNSHNKKAQEQPQTEIVRDSAQKAVEDFVSKNYRNASMKDRWERLVASGRARGRDWHELLRDLQSDLRDSQLVGR